MDEVELLYGVLGMQVAENGEACVNLVRGGQAYHIHVSKPQAEKLTLGCSVALSVKVVSPH